MSETKAPVRRGRAAVVVLTLLLVVALIALALLGRAWKHQHDLDTAGDQAEKAARSAVIEMTTYDYRSLDKDFAWVDDAGTDKFRRHYAEVSAPVKKLVTRMKASAHGTVVASAANVQDTSHVTVLLFVDQTLTNPGQAQRGLDQPRVTMKMVKQDGRWLVDDVTLNNLSSN